MTVKLKINGKQIETQAGKTVLEAAGEHGITIPTLCHHRDLTPYGGCRLCVVEVEGLRVPQAACTLPVNEGMVVQTETSALIEARKTILELLLSNFVDMGYTPPVNGGERGETEFSHWLTYYGVQRANGVEPAPRYPIDSDPNPFVRVDLNKCILCSRCVRACAEVQGRFVWGLAERGFDTRIVAGVNTTMLDARCESCGACVAYCPTGALDNKMSIELGQPDKLVTTTCTYCGVGCQFDLNVKDGRVIRVTSNPNAPVNGMALCVKGRYGYDFIHHPDRLTKPRVRRYLLDEGRKTKDEEKLHSSSVLRRSSDWVEVDWDIALDITARKLRQARDTYGADSVGILTSAKCLNEENYLMNKFARQVIGTNNIDHCARL
jgi:formate dehydrogenase major subunit/formate dehydrogenase alpha subunit